MMCMIRVGIILLDIVNLGGTAGAFYALVPFVGAGVFSLPGIIFSRLGVCSDDR